MKINTLDLINSLSDAEYNALKNQMKALKKNTQTKLLEHLRNDIKKMGVKKVDKESAFKAVYGVKLELKKGKLNAIEHVLRNEILNFLTAERVKLELKENDLFKIEWELKVLEERNISDKLEAMFDNAISHSEKFNRFDVMTALMKRLIVYNNNKIIPSLENLKKMQELVERRQHFTRAQLLAEERYHESLSTILKVHVKALNGQEDYSDFIKPATDICLTAHDYEYPVATMSYNMNLAYQSPPEIAVGYLKEALNQSDKLTSNGRDMSLTEQTIISNIALKYYESGDFVSAEKYLNRLIDAKHKTTQSLIYYFALHAKVQNHKLDQAIEFYKKYEGQLSKNPLSESVLVMAFILSGNIDSANQYLQKSLRRLDSPYRPYYYCLQFAIMWTNNDINNAEKSLRNGRDSLKNIETARLDMNYERVFEISEVLLKSHFTLYDRKKRLKELLDNIIQFRNSSVFWIKYNLYILWLQREAETHIENTK